MSGWREVKQQRGRNKSLPHLAVACLMLSILVSLMQIRGPLELNFHVAGLEGLGRVIVIILSCALTNTESYTIRGEEKVTSIEFYWWAIHRAKHFTLSY